MRLYLKNLAKMPCMYVIYKETQFCQPNANGLQNVSTCQLGNCIYQARNKSWSAKKVTQHSTIKKTNIIIWPQRGLKGNGWQIALECAILLMTQLERWPKQKLSPPTCFPSYFIFPVAVADRTRQSATVWILTLQGHWTHNDRKFMAEGRTRDY